MVLASARSNADARVVATQYGADAFRGKVATGDVGLTTDESSAFRDVESYPVHRIKDEPVDTPRGLIAMEGSDCDD